MHVNFFLRKKALGRSAIGRHDMDSDVKHCVIITHAIYLELYDQNRIHKK